MKNIVLSIIFALLLIACVAKDAKKKKVTEKQKSSCSASDETSTLTISADEL